MLQDVELKFVSLKTVPVGTTWKGYYGGRFINKFGKGSMTLYSKNEDGGYLCSCFPLAAGLKREIMPNTGFMELKYNGMGFTGQYHAHKFEVRCLPIPAENSKALAFMKKLQQHTESLNDQGQVAAQKPKDLFPDQGDDPFGFTGTVSKLPMVETKTSKQDYDPFSLEV